MLVTIYGVDIAGSYQADISIHQLAVEGQMFVACKATEGTTFTSPHFDEWMPQIRAEGMICGAYHYLRAGHGARQADFFLSKLRPHGGPAGMLIQLDCEADAEWQDILDWVARWKTQTDSYPFAFYTGDWWLGAAHRGWDVASLTPYLWAAPNRGYTGHYTGPASPDWVAGYGGYLDMSIEQFTSVGNSGGLNHNVDIDAIRDPAALAALVRGSAAHDVSGPAAAQAGPKEMIVTHWQTVWREHTNDRATRIVQGLLLGWGLSVGSRSGRPDGDWGPATDHSVRAFQAGHGLGVDGQVGPHTISTLVLGRDVA